MRKKFSFYMILFLVLAVAGIAAANYGWAHRCQEEASPSSHGAGRTCLIKCGDLPCPKMVLNAKAELELTDDQVTQIKALTVASKKEKIRIKADIKILELEIGELLDKKEVDKAAIDAKVDEIAKLAARCTKSCIQTKLDTKALLTEEQLQKLGSLVSSGAIAKPGCSEKADAAGPAAAAVAEPKCPKSN